MEKIDKASSRPKQSFQGERKNRFAERFSLVLKGETNVSFAEKVGVTETTVRRYLAGDTVPNLDVLERISEVTGVSLGWLASGQGPMKGTHLSDKPEELQPHVPMTAVSIPMYEVEAAAGAGSWINEENIVDYWYLPHSWLRQERLEHANLCIINAIGDSMAPGINSGDRLLVKLNINRDKGLEGVFVISLDGNLRVKRLEVSMFPHGYRIRSDNELYKEEFVPASEMQERLHIIGEVVRVFGAPASAPDAKVSTPKEERSPLGPEKGI